MIIRANYTKAKNEAAKVISENFVGRPPIDVFSLVENYGISIYETEFASPYDNSLCGYIDLNRNIMMINSKDNSQRKRFTVAHELGHWLLHSSEIHINPNMAVLTRRPIGGEKDPFEQEANCFASWLLVPPHMLIKVLPNIDTDIDDVKRTISKEFEVSPQMAAFRWEGHRRDNGNFTGTQ